MMCGIAGMVGVNPQSSILQSMTASMRHRGPDDTGEYIGQNVGLAFQRLSIVDLTDGHQPMANEDGQVQVVFNGEIYNHQPLRETLVGCGHQFKTHHSDTEALVHGWEQWGALLFPRLNGMFGLAIWDALSRTLVLARDRYGIKPVYYAPLPSGGLIFASEIKAILASGLISCEPCHSAVLEYFLFQNIWSESTMFKGIYQLPAGTMLTFQDGRIEKRCYWDITFPRSRREGIANLAVEHRAILQRSLKRQIAADVPVNSYLSGGIDSSAITIGANRLDKDITAYSCIFDLDTVGADHIVDEREYSRLIAKTYGMPRVELKLEKDSLLQCFDECVMALEDLRMGMSYPVYMIAKRVAQDSKVVLSGTGGDEFHGGYVYRYQALQLHKPSPRQRMHSFMRQMLGRMRPDRPAPPVGQDAIYRSLLNFLVPLNNISSALTSAFIGATAGYDGNQVISDLLDKCPSNDWRDKVMYVDAKTYLNGLLVMEDKLSMASSLETRVPLLDNELIDFVLDVPFDTLWQGDAGKRLFRESVRPWVPHEIYTKPKMGFGPPDASWYRSLLRPWIEDQLSPYRIKQRGIFHPEFVSNLLTQHFSGQRNNVAMIWSLLSFERWCEQYNMYGGALPSRRRSTSNAA